MNVIADSEDEGELLMLVLAFLNDIAGDFSRDARNEVDRVGIMNEKVHSTSLVIKCDSFGRREGGS